MKNVLPRILSEHGMIFVLLLLCGFFSAVTYREQSPTGAAAGRQLADAIHGNFGGSPRILIVVRAVPEDFAFAEELRRGVEANGGKVLAVVQGEPKNARAASRDLPRRVLGLMPSPPPRRLRRGGSSRAYTPTFRHSGSRAS